MATTSRAFVVSSPSSSRHDQGPTLQIKVENRKATYAMAFFRKGSFPTVCEQNAFVEQEAVMIAKLRSISEIAPITDDESDALTEEWNADFEEKDHQTQK
ncbi:hypothetical protein pneo_cds_306 [Pandoravirus neocaledonia]|uniref:Uncharacterized protein n=1 Tax=Pandoravirus neocaledonia TaxID=2107708 RepID=A0A2U7UBV1_9VIRU|nr:hypothetical protein pneo_cds_306 [Pandoravirus neocaledonia]AVK75913.1 hypothetical protein pneo_cds_306 [Pandoravirus neocaledonia]